MIRTLVWIIAALTLNFGCQAYVDGSKRTAGEFADDAQITAMVKIRLWDDPEVKGWRINVTTKKGVVILEGRVPSSYARDKAIRIAGATGSVVGVEDRLIVVEQTIF